MISPAVKKLLIAIVAGQFLLFGVLVVFLHQGRQSQVENSRAGCERGKLDRASIVVIASGTYGAFRATDKRIGQPLTKKRIAAETGILVATQSLASRTGTKLNCKDAFPDASWLPWSKDSTKVFERPTEPTPIVVTLPKITKPSG